MLDNLNKYKIILASNSPRRKELLSGLGLPYEVRTLPDVDESFPSTLTGEEIPRHIAREKAEAYRKMMTSDELIITADTIVWLQGEVLGKPHDEEEAIQMLGKLSGKTHQVITGVCLMTTQRTHCFSAVSEVRFANLTPQEIDYYVSNYHPLDKAGSYGVQEWIGYVAVESIVGSFYNVMGLPIQKLYKELKAL